MTTESDLSERECDILRLVATGASNKEIAQQLVISPNTVKVHLRNIFAKIGVVSRTEATLYAIREGLVEAPVVANGENHAAEEIAEPVAPPIPEPVPQSMWQRLGRYRFLAVALMVLLVLVVGVGVVLVVNQFSPTPVVQPTTPVSAQAQPAQSSERWTAQPDLNTARSGAASTVYDDQIYLLAGEDSSGVTGRVDRYELRTQTWTTHTAKPTPVTLASAGLIGERIFLPGGKDAQGNVLAGMEVYDPRGDTWKKVADLPAPRCAYALAVYEGRLFVIGGWDGERVSATVFEYDPESDTWTERTPMPTARAYAAGAVAGGRIFVVGGWDGRQALAVNEAYYPQRDQSGETPWETRAPLPEARSGASMTALADMLYVINGSENTPATPYQYMPLV
ncbi:MAG: kelch repeat-containing protein, partial [Anaerolineaceae bacterium]